MKKSTLFLAVCLLTLFSGSIWAQAGMTVSPGKLYYKLVPGATATQKVIVSNPHDKPLEIGASVSDWNYDSVGNTLTPDPGTLENSCADWFRVLPGSFFTLGPREKRELDIVFTVPQNADQRIPVHTAMLFLTQLNPGDARAADGTSLKVTVRMGVKLYHSFTPTEVRDIEILDLKDVKDSSNTAGMLEMTLKNTGKSWLEGKIKWELLNTQNGDKRKLEDQDIYSLPGDLRIVRQPLPANLPKGRYTVTAVINYGNKDELKVAELEFVR